MADTPFSQTNIGVRERPVSSDLNSAQSEINRTIRELQMRLVSPRTSNANATMNVVSSFIGDGLRVIPSGSPAMTVQVSAGIGFLFDPIDVPSNVGSPDVEGVNDMSQFKPACLVAPVTFAVPAAPGPGLNRRDIIEVRNDRRLSDSTPREQLDVPTRAFNPHNFFKSLEYAYDGQTGAVSDPASSTAGLSYKIGIASAPGTAPTVTAGYTKLATIVVGNGTTSIVGTNIVDERKIQAPGGVINCSAMWRQRWNAGAPIVNLISKVAPPGVEIAIAAAGAVASGTHSSGVLYVVGGQITHATCAVSASDQGDLLDVIGGLGISQTAGSVTAVGSGEQTAMSGVGVSIGQTSKVALFVYQARTISGTVANADDVIWCANFTLGYH